MAILKTEALVLQKYDLRETSMLVNFFSRDFGKISGELKGIRAEPGKFASNLELFSLNEIIFYRKRNSSVHLVSQADKTHNFEGIRNDISKSTMASFMMELVSAVMPQEDANQEIFELTHTSLKELEVNPMPEKITTIFKIKMLALSGFKPNLDSCVACEDRISDQSKFSLSLGGLLCPRCWHKDSSSRTIFRGTVATILHIERNEFKNNLTLGMNPQIKRELEMILNAFLTFHLEKELKSQKVLNKLAMTV
jgi:DNA repair protein RecO (recombination protein O)